MGSVSLTDIQLACVKYQSLTRPPMACCDTREVEKNTLLLLHSILPLSGDSEPGFVLQQPVILFKEVPRLNQWSVLRVCYFVVPAAHFWDDLLELFGRWVISAQFVYAPLYYRGTFVSFKEY